MSETELKLNTVEEREETALVAAKTPAVMEEIIEMLSGGSRSKRQRGASTVALVALGSPEALSDYMEQIIEAVTRPEDQTRWECLNALSSMVQSGVQVDEDALVAAEDALFDEKSGIVREAAFRFLINFGLTGPEASDKVWPLIDEAIQCFHGNGEFADMLTALVEFAEGDISLETSEALTSRMKFDSETARGTLRMRSEQIVAAGAKRTAAGK